MWPECEPTEPQKEHTQSKGIATLAQRGPQPQLGSDCSFHHLSGATVQIKERTNQTKASIVIKMQGEGTEKNKNKKQGTKGASDDYRHPTHVSE